MADGTMSAAGAKPSRRWVPDSGSSGSRPYDRRGGFRWPGRRPRSEAVALTAEQLNRPVAMPGRDRAGPRSPRPLPTSKAEQRGEDIAGVPPHDCAIENKRRAVPAQACAEHDPFVGVGQRGERGAHDTAGLAGVDRADRRWRAPVGEHAGHVESRRWDVQARQQDQRLDGCRVDSGLLGGLADRGGGPASPSSRAPPGNATSPAWSRSLGARCCSRTSGPSARSVAIRIRTAACRSAAVSGTGSLRLSSSGRAAATASIRPTSGAGTTDARRSVGASQRARSSVSDRSTFRSLTRFSATHSHRAPASPDPPSSPKGSRQAGGLNG